MSHALAAHVMSHPMAGSAFRALVGYPLFGSAFRNLWPLLLMPMLAACIAELGARNLPYTQRSWIPAALLAALPGMVVLVELWPALTASMLGTTDNWRGLVLLWFTPAAGLMLATYALLRALLRQRECMRLFRTADEPGERLARAAAALGLRARELATDHKECFVAGMLRPTVFVSRGALAQLGEQELLAALHHERAHVRGRDTLLLFLLSFMRDLAPSARVSALEVYQAAREVAADREAIAHAGPLNLASALVALARPGPAPVGALPMASPDTLRWRLQALLQTDATAPAKDGSWARAALGLAAGAALMIWPLAQLQLLSLFCWG